jgi:hypothetical protein
MSSAVQLAAKRRFRFEKFWLKLEGFGEVVEASWNAGSAHADPICRLDRKLRRLAKDLQRWSSMKVGSIRDQILIANEVIFRLDAAQEGRALSAAEAELRRNLKLRLLGLASLKRMIARQRARVARLKEGDAATHFFRINASKRQRHTHIVRLRNGEAVAVEQLDKEELASTFFADLLGRAVPRPHDLDLPAMGLPPVELIDLEAEFSDDEIWAAIKAMPSNKSPGRDRFSWEFFRFCWGTVKADVTAAIQAVFAGRDQAFGSMNCAFITLLPKKEDAVDLKEFRPISLVHFFAKLVPKLLAIRLSPKMPELVSCNQSAFIRGRCIHDKFVLVRQTAVTLHRK